MTSRGPGSAPGGAKSSGGSDGPSAGPGEPSSVRRPPAISTEKTLAVPSPELMSRQGSSDRSRSSSSQSSFSLLGDDDNDSQMFIGEPTRSRKKKEHKHHHRLGFFSKRKSKRENPLDDEVCPLEKAPTARSARSSATAMTAMTAETVTTAKSDRTLTAGTPTSQTAPASSPRLMEPPVLTAISSTSSDNVEFHPDLMPAGGKLGGKRKSVVSSHHGSISGASISSGTPGASRTHSSSDGSSGNVPASPQQTRKKQQQAPSAPSSGRRGKSLRHFGKRALKVVGDVAFGSAMDEEDKPRTAPSVRPGTLPGTVNYQEVRLEEFQKKVGEVSFEMYLKHLRFFLKYMDDSEPSDPLNYAVTRRDMWQMWYKKFLLALSEDIKTYESLQQTIPIARLRVNKQQSTEIQGAALPNIDDIKTHLFRDRRSVLSLLWYRQIRNMLFHREAGNDRLNRLFSRKNAYGTDPAVTEQFCFVTGNKLDTHNLYIEDSTHQLLKNSIAGAEVEFIDGWHLRHGLTNLQLNVVTITHRKSRLYDPKHRAVEVGSADEGTSEDYLSAHFKRVPLNERERRFLENYASMTTDAIYDVPLPDNSQIGVACEGITLHPPKEETLDRTLKEFYRVLKPGGVFYVDVRDIDPLARFSVEQKMGNIKTESEYAFYNMYRLLGEYAAKNVRVMTDLTAKIVPALKRAGFINIKSTIIGYPHVSSVAETKDVEFAPETTRTGSVSSSMGESASNPTSDLTLRRASTAQSSSHMKDNRANALFDFLSSFTDIMLAGKILELHEMDTKLRPCAELRRGKVKGQARDKLLANLPDISKERLHLAKLFIDWKLNGMDGKLTRAELMKDRPDNLSTENRLVDPDTFYEGTNYTMLITAEHP